MIQRFSRPWGGSLEEKTILQRIIRIDEKFVPPRDMCAPFHFGHNQIGGAHGRAPDHATFVHLDLVYVHPNVPSETSRGTEFVAWAEFLIAVASPR